MDRDRLTRRIFHAHLAASAMGSFALANPTRFAPDHSPDLAEPGKPTKGDTPRIAGVVLQSSQPIETMRKFYAQALGFKIVRETKDEITLRTGKSTLTFGHAPDSGAFYHFAFNIPENQIKQAYAWQQERTELIVPPAHLNDAGMAREIVAFRHWNAHSVFFFDPADNLVEFIARHDLKNASDDPFSVESALYLSEIGLVVDDVPKAATRLKAALNLETYVSARPVFEPIGDQLGLLLLMSTDGKMAFGQGKKRGVYPTEVMLRASKKSINLEPYPYAIKGA